MGTFMQVYYEKPLLPDYSQISLACEKEITCATNEKTRYPQFSQHSTRLATFVNCQFFTDHQDAANLGFFYKGLEDIVCCYECGVTLSQWKKDDDPLLEHIRYPPECKHLAAIVDTATLKDCKTQLQQVRMNEARQGATGVRLAITSAQEKRILVRSPQYSSLNVRLSTFGTFAATNGLDVHRIAPAGFYYTGDKDIVRCYACDGGLKQWVGGDDPWDEHYRWFPNCSYLKQSNYNPPGKNNKPESTRRKTAEKPLIAAREAPAPEVVARRLNKLAIDKQKPKELTADPDLNTPAALAVLDFGYSRKAVKMAIKELGSKGQTRLTADGILQVLIAFEDNGMKLPTDDDK